MSDIKSNLTGAYKKEVTVGTPTGTGDASNPAGAVTTLPGNGSLTGSVSKHLPKGK